MTTRIPHADHGIAGYWESAPYVTVELFAGSTPQVITDTYNVGENTDIPKNAAVALDDDNNIVLATQGTPAIGITTYAVKTSAGQTAKAGLYVAGCFNVDALTFDASYLTVDDKVAAFRGAGAPTQIIVRVPNI